MAGFIRPSENLTETVQRVVYEYTGIQDMFLEQVGVYSDIGRDIGERVISIACYALVDIQLFDEELYKTYNARWEELEKVGKMVFDHNKMVSDAIHILRQKVMTQPIGFNLLPEKFTLPQLQRLYEAIYQAPLDKRNFRKKINEMDILDKQEDKDKSGSKKGAFYYKFNKEKYDALLEREQYFSL